MGGLYPSVLFQQTSRKTGCRACRFPLLLFIFFLISCQTDQQQKKETPPFSYPQFKDSVLRANAGLAEDSTNLFDLPFFTPGKDPVIPLLEKIDTLWKREAAWMAKYDTFKSKLNTGAGFSPEEKSVIEENIRIVDSFLLARDSAIAVSCREKDCMIYALIDKSSQTLYLYIMGEPADSFRVSTGKGKKYETPQMERHPSGPVLTKYKSRKFPGGNYKGLGNMPYAVFISGGYAIHGTTPGNYAKLGTKASHGCIRLHPDHGKLFNALVKTAGLRQTWISIRDSLPQRDSFHIK